MKTNTISLCMVFILLIISSTSVAQEAADSDGQNSMTAINFIQNFKSNLNSSGLDLEFGYTGEVFSNLAGGMEKKSVYLDNFDLIFSMDLEKLIGWNGASLSTYVLGNHGGEPADYAGAIQGISNIAAHDTWKIYEIRLEQFLMDGRLSLLAGLYDLNSEFDTREFSSVFINPSHGIGAEFAMTGQNGPSIFPTASLAFRISYDFSSSWNIKAAVFDGIPGDPDNPNGTKIKFDKEDGLLLTSEVNYTNESSEVDGNYFKYALGGWYYTGDFETISGTDFAGNPLIHSGNYGFYGSAEKFIYTEQNNDTEGLAAFLRLGWANNNVNQVNSYIGAGINYFGLLPGRENDVFGFAIAAAHNNQKYIDLMAEDNIKMEDFEYILELTYNLYIADWIQVQPDIQYIINPAASIINDYSFIYGTRLQIGF